MDLQDLSGLLLIGLLIGAWYFSKGTPTRTKVLVWTAAILAGGLITYLIPAN